LPPQERVRRFVPALEHLEWRVLPSTVIPLDSSGSGFAASTLLAPAAFDFTATVPGTISVLMHAEQPGMQSQLTAASGTTITDQTFVPSQVAGSRDDLVQFTNVKAGEVFHLSAGLASGSVAGAYQLYISTEPTDFSATTPHMISLDSSGLGVQLGTIETPGDADLFAFTAAVTGQATVRVDGGAISSQEVRLDTISGQTYGLLVSDADNHTGPYVLTVDLIANDIDWDLSKTSTLPGTINFPDDVNNFRFTATQSGLVTLKMQNQPESDDNSTLHCALSVSGATETYSISPPRDSVSGSLGNDRIVQFEVVKGHQYTIQASGANGTIGSYRLSLSMAVDDSSATVPHVISLDTSTGAGSQTGTIEFPGDKNLFQFTATADGYVVVALRPEGSSREGNLNNGPWEPGTNMQGLLSFPAATPIVQGVVVSPFAAAFSGPLKAFSFTGLGEATRDDFAAIQVTKGDTYEFFVSTDGNTIGDYTLALATYPSGAMATFVTTSDIGEQSLTFDFSTATPSLTIKGPPPAVSPVTDTSPPATTPTNTRLAAFTLPSSNTTTPPSTVAVPSGQSTGTAMVPGGPSTGAATVPSGQSTGASNTLIATLLTVAARDNSQVVPGGQSTGVETVSSGQSTGAVTFLTSLLSGLVALGPGGYDLDTDPLIRGTVFDDLHGGGRQSDNEPGLAGEKVLLEVHQGGQYVIVNTATTDARGAYAFPDVNPGDYRVRLVTEGGSGSDLATPTSHTVKVLSDSKPRTINFRKASKRGATRNDPGQPSNCLVVDDVIPPQENALFEEVDRVFRDLDEVGAAALIPDDVERDGSARDRWFGLLAPIAILGIASIQSDIPAVERRPGTSRRRET
jgi:hypothetical protein